MRILALVTDAFGGYGGIAQYNRDFLAALSSSRHVKRSSSCRGWPTVMLGRCQIKSISCNPTPQKQPTSRRLCARPEG